MADLSQVNGACPSGFVCCGTQCCDPDFSSCIGDVCVCENRDKLCFRENSQGPPSSVTVGGCEDCPDPFTDFEEGGNCCDTEL